MIVAVDYDETLWDGTQIIPEAVDWIKQWQEAGITVDLWTNRSGFLLNWAVNKCKEQGIVFSKINKSPWWYRLWSNSPKIYADYFVDDRNVGCPLIYRDELRPIVNWSKVGPLVLKLNLEWV